MDADAIINAKENIQPLRSGRKTRQLGLALQAQEDPDLQHKLLEERDQYEILIRMYEGPDPLQPRYDYVSWIEQSCPKHGRESNLVPLLEDTISLFKDDPRYVQDQRFISLITKFIETQVNPLELYQVVFNQGIGTMCAILYKAWAEELDAVGDLKRADQVFQMGISNRAQPLDLLIQEHKQYQLIVGRRVLNGLGLNESDDDTPVEMPRQVLGKLKKTKVGSLRKNFGKAGKIPLCLSNSNTPKPNAPIAVYQEPNEEMVSCRGIKVDSLPNSVQSQKENTIKPSTWNKSYKTASIPHYESIPVTPKFKIHEDPDAEYTKETPSVSTNALKPRKADTFHCPMAVFEPPDPSVRHMYCKHKIYASGREFQLEEIRAAIYNKRRLENIAKEETKKLGLVWVEKEPEQKDVSKDPSSVVSSNTIHTVPFKTPSAKDFLKPSPMVECTIKKNTEILTTPIECVNAPAPPKCVNKLLTIFNDDNHLTPRSDRISSNQIGTSLTPKLGTFCDESDSPSVIKCQPLNEEESSPLVAVVGLDNNNPSLTKSSHHIEKKITHLELERSGTPLHQKTDATKEGVKIKRNFTVFCDSDDRQTSEPTKSQQKSNPYHPPDVKPLPNGRSIFPIYEDDEVNTTKPLVKSVKVAKKKPVRKTFTVFCDD